MRGVKKAHMASQEQKMTQETTEQLAEKFMQKVLANWIKGIPRGTFEQTIIKNPSTYWIYSFLIIEVR